MFLSKSFVTLGLVSLPFTFAAVHEIKVGADGLSFTPEAISAEVGDQVSFTFLNKNHSVTQSSFDNPCGPKDGGFNSGFMPVPQNQTDNLPIHTISVYSKDPMWIFCAQTAPINHCGQGMVFAINCGADDQPNSFTNFKKAALAFGASQSSAAPAPSSTPDASSGGYGGYGSSSGSPADSSAPPPPPAPSAPADSGSPPASSGNSVSASDNGEQVIRVQVGDSQGSLLFNPANVSAPVGAKIMFEFHQKNHSVVQSTFASPCTSNGGFKSDFFAVDPSTTTGFSTWNITVNTTDPIWAYCRQTAPKSHCGAGMVFSVNAVEGSGKGFSDFQTKAEQQNGTASGSGSGSGNGALPSHVSGAGMFLTAVAVLVSLL